MQKGRYSNYAHLWAMLLTMVLVGSSISVFAQNAKKRVPKPYEACGYYDYFPGDNTILSASDSLELFSYAAKVKAPATDFVKLLNFLPRVQRTVDEAWYDKLMLDKSGKAQYKSLRWVNLATLINADAVVIGEVIDKVNYVDTGKCFYYKSSYFVKVKEVINANIDVREGDIVMIKHTSGYMGGCSKNPKMYMTSNYGREYKIGEKNVFLLQHYKYKTWFVRIRQDEKKKKRFNDKFCEHAFIIPFNNDKFDISNTALLNDTRLFFQHKENLFKQIFPEKKKPVTSDAKTGGGEGH